jgi:enoyl-CoA hydratase
MSLVASGMLGDGIALVQMDDGARYNALTTGMVTGLKAAFAAVGADRDVRVVVLAGAGRGFCSGANMTGGDEVPESARRRGPVGLVQMMQEHLAELILAIHELPQPVIAAVHGGAIGGGLAVAADEAKQIGLLNRVVAKDGLLDAAADLAATIAANSEYGVYMTKLGLWANLDAPSLRHAIQLENRTQVLGTFTGNMTEAGKAFVEKRPPVWKPM